MSPGQAELCIEEKGVEKERDRGDTLVKETGVAGSWVADDDDDNALSIGSTASESSARI